MRSVVLRFVHDDAFYYFSIARQWNHLGFSTCDGLNPTNGYHPLWQWLLVPAAGWFSDPAVFVRVFSAAGALLLLAAALLIRRRLVSDQNPCSDLSFYWVGGSLAFATIYGMEAPLAAFLLALTLALVPRSDARWTLRRAAALAIASSLLFLSRIDSLAGILALDFLLIFACFFAPPPGANSHRPFAKLALLISIQTLVIGAYFFHNLRAWGHLLPISALLKSSRARLFSFSFPFNFLLLLAIPATLAGAFLLFDYLNAFFRRPIKSSGNRISPGLAAAWLGLADLLAMAQIAAKGSAETYNWYFVPVVLSGAYLFPAALARWGSGYSSRLSSRFLSRAFIAVCLLCLAINLRGKILKPSNFADSYDRALALAAFPPGSLTLAANDCGILGYFSGQHVINLDGLTNSFDFQNALADDRLADWLKQHGLNAYAGSFPYAGPLEKFGVPLATRRSLSGPARSVWLLLDPKPMTPAGGISGAGPIPVWRVRAIAPIQR